MEEIEIRKATLADLDDCFQVIKACRDMLSEQGMNNWKRYTKEKVAEIIRSNNLFLLRMGRETIGTIKATEQAPSFYSPQDMGKWENAKSRALYITALAVTPKYQGGGYGSMLLDYVENYAKVHEINYLRMTTFSKNVPLSKYYKKRGFTFPQTREVSELDLTLSFGEKRL